MPVRNIGLLAIAVLLLTCGSVVWILCFGSRARAVHEAEHAARDYSIVRDLQYRAEHHQTLSPAQVQKLIAFTNVQEWQVQIRALSALACLGGTESAGPAAHAASARLGDGEGIVRQYALRTLELLHAPNLQDAAKRLKNDPDEWARGKAWRILGYPPSRR